MGKALVIQLPRQNWKLCSSMYPRRGSGSKTTWFLTSLDMGFFFLPHSQLTWLSLNSLPPKNDLSLLNFLLETLLRFTLAYI